MDETPQFGEAYQGARKAYGLSSALLVAWELIGIEFGAAPIESLNLTLKSPQAVPYVLLALIVYFSFRFVIEWYQTHPLRRAILASRVDFIAAHLIGVLALLLYAYQTLTRSQLANQLSAHTALPSFLMGAIEGGFISFVLPLFFATLRNIKEIEKLSGTSTTTSKVGLVVFVSLSFVFVTSPVVKVLVQGMAKPLHLFSGLAVGSGIGYMWARHVMKPRPASTANLIGQADGDRKDAVPPLTS